MSQSRSMGYTLAEMMVVLLIVSAVAVVAVPAVVAPLSEARLSAAVTEVVTALEFARMTVIGSGRLTRVTIDDTADTVLVERFTTGVSLLGGEPLLHESLVEGGAFVPMPNPLNRSADYLVSLSDDGRFRGVDIVSASFGVNDWVVFNELGIPSSSGAVVLASGAHQVTITLSPVTGAVSTIN